MVPQVAVAAFRAGLARVAEMMGDPAAALAVAMALEREQCSSD